jgi:hypothetical protein
VGYKVPPKVPGQMRGAGPFLGGQQPLDSSIEGQTYVSGGELSDFARNEINCKREGLAGVMQYVHKQKLWSKKILQVQVRLIQEMRINSNNYCSK